MGNEVKDWLEGHIADLQAALAEICDREHAYHYSPPGYHIDEDAIDLQAFERLSERFTLMVVQMTGTFDGFTTEINTRIKALKEDEKYKVTLTVTAAERSLTMATTAFGEGIEYVNDSVKMKAGLDHTAMMSQCTEAR